MSATRPDFLAIEIDALDASLDAKLAETARRKRIPSLTLDRPVPAESAPSGSSEELGGDSPKPRPKAKAVSVRPTVKFRIGRQMCPQAKFQGLSPPTAPDRKGRRARCVQWRVGGRCRWKYRSIWAASSR
jgi:hypothetical protein